jgi:nitrite reductase/ring-hydroxylating ferredoxin subunit
MPAHHDKLYEAMLAMEERIEETWGRDVQVTDVLILAAVEDDDEAAIEDYCTDPRGWVRRGMLRDTLFD